MEPAWIEYPYIRWNEDQGVVEYRPFLPVVVHGSAGYVPVNGLIDSGADDSIVSLDLAEPLGVNLQTAIPIRVAGVGGHGMDGFKTKVTIEVPDFGLKFETPVIFSDLPTPLVLGQKNFFQYFRVLFEGDRAVFKLTRAPKLTD